MNRRPGEPGRPGGFWIEMQRIVVAGHRRITRERFPRKRPEVVRADSSPAFWPIRRHLARSRFDHDADSKLSGTTRSTVSRCAQSRPCEVETAIFKVKRGGFAVRRASTART